MTRQNFASASPYRSIRKLKKATNAVKRAGSQASAGQFAGAGLTHSPGPAARERLYADIMPPDETPAMLNEQVNRWRAGQDG